MSTHYCEIHASGRIYNPPLLILRSATPLVLRLAVVRICMPRPSPNLRASAFPSLRTPVFSVLRSTVLLVPQSTFLPILRSLALSVFRFTLLPVPRPLILSVYVSSFCDFSILVLRFRVLDPRIPTPFEFADSDSSRFCRLQLFRTAIATSQEPALLRRYDISPHVQMFHVKHPLLHQPHAAVNAHSAIHKRGCPSDMTPRQ